MNIIEINTKKFSSSQDIFIIHHTLAEFLNMLSTAYVYILIDLNSLLPGELDILVKRAKSAAILYYNETPEMQEQLDCYAHFSITRIINHEDYQQTLSDIHQAFFIGQEAGFFAPSEFAVLANDVPGKVTRLGRYEILCEGDYGDKPVEVLRWADPFIKWNMWNSQFSGSTANVTYQGNFDYDVTGSIQVTLTFSYAFSDGRIEKEVFTGHDIFAHFPEGAAVYLTLSLTGAGHIRIGKIYLQEDRKGYGYFVPGDKKKITKTNETIWYHYFPGKKKDKLLITFTGAQGEFPRYEYLTYNVYDHPMFAFLDQRGRGGVFQLGKGLDERYEYDLMSIINEKLDELGLLPKDIVINGYSMGSFAALYYGTKLGAGTIIASKPLVHIGDMTGNPKVMWRAGANDGLMPESRMYLMGRSHEDDTVKLNQYLLDVLNEADLSKTTYYIFAMEQDELDGKAFDVLTQSLTGRCKKLITETTPGYHSEKISEMHQFINRAYKEVGMEAEK